MNIYDLMTSLAACLAVELENIEAPVCWVGVAPGDGMVLDNTGCKGGKCGQAWVRLGTSYPSVTVGVQDVTTGNCTKPLGIDLEMGVMRCFAVNEKTLGPKDSDMVSRRQIADMQAMHRAVVCCASDEEIVMGSYQPAPILGGMAGGTWLLHVGTL